MMTSKLSRLIVIDPLSEHHIGIIAYSKLELFQLTGRNTFRVVFRPVNRESFEYAVYLAIARGNLTLMIDEAHLYTSSWYISPALNYAIQCGRHHRLSLILVSPMPNRIRADIMNQADEIISFQARGSAAKYLGEFADSDELDLQNLPPYTALPVVGETDKIFDGE